VRIYGINPVLEALRAGRVTAIRISTRADDRLTEIVGLATAQGIPVRRTNVDELNRFSHRGSHQGVVADVRDQTTLGVEDLIAGASGSARSCARSMRRALTASSVSRATRRGSTARPRRRRPAPCRTCGSPTSSTSRGRSTR